MMDTTIQPATYEERPSESADAAKWLETIKKTRDFDKASREQYARDRRYARGDCGQFVVDVNICGTYIDILNSFLYARDPDIDCLPAESTGEARLENARLFGKTLEIVIRRLWRRGKLKSQAERWVRSALTVGIGWMKVTWQRQMGEDPIIRNQLNSLQDNLQRLAQSKKDATEGNVADTDALEASLEQQIAGLQAKVEVLQAHGLGIDFVSAEDMTVSPDCADIGAYADAPWIAHRTFIATDDARAMFPKVADKIKSATTYQQVKPKDPAERRDAGTVASVSAEDADQYVQGSGDACGTSVCVYEVWHHKDNTVLTLVEGLNCYARDPYQPTPGTSRWYPFFQWSPIKVDGDRHPQSLVTRSARLLDEYNRIRSKYMQHRDRIMPKTGFDSTNLSKEDADKIAGGLTGEMIPLKPTRPGTPIAQLLQPITYPNIDPALYDTSVIRSELEMIWGIQEALSASIRVAKTATEAEIQQTGTNARTGHQRDTLDGVMTEIAQYTGEIAVQSLSLEDVQGIAGPEALWPEGITIDDLEDILVVEIRAGSTGKPNTTAQREAWATIMPLLQNAIMQVAQMRQSDPLDVADCIAELVGETLERTGEHIDPERFLPAAPQIPPGMDPMAAQPVPTEQLQ